MVNMPFSTQSKVNTGINFFRSLRGTLILLFLTVALIPLLTVGVLAYTQAQQALRAEAEAKLVAVRDIKANQIETYLATIESQVRTLSEDRMIIQAMRDFKQGFHSLEKELALDEAEMQQYQTSVRNYYQGEYLTRLNPNLKAPASVDTYWPADNNTHLAQYLYIANNPNPTGSKEILDTAGDSSRYSRFHQTYHPIIRNYLREFGYYDIFLVDPDTGHIVYTVFKEVDYSISLLTGPYKDTNFAAAFRAARAATDPDFVYLADFEPYHPSYNAPASFIASPIFDGNEKVGVLLFQMPIDRINAIMQEKSGLGETGETYLVGADTLMRSDSRFSEESTILQKEIYTLTTGKALDGQTGVEVTPDYRGVPVLSAYEPLNIKGLEWVILAEIDKAEAFGPAQQMLIVMLIIVGVGAVAVAGAAFFVANSLSKPVLAVTEIARKLAVGDVNQTVEVKSRNEIGVMAGAFRQMIAYQQQIAAVATQMAEGDLTTNVTPQSDRDALGNAFCRMITNLTALIKQTQQGAEQVASASQQLNASADQAGQAGQQVATTIQQVAAGTSQQAQAVTEATTNAEQMSRGAESIARGAQEQAQGIQETSDLIDEVVDIVEQVGQIANSVTEANSKVTQAARHGVSAVQQTGQGMATIRTRSTDAVAKVKEMGARSKEIGRIVDTIDEIADKTDMLALNAAVEAARAGEHGRGFAVVADQVRKLSEDSKSATRDINDLIERVQNTINEAVVAMESTSAKVDNGTRLAEETTQSLQDILQAAEAAADMAERITEAVAELKQKSEGVVTAIGSVSTVVEENTVAAEEMAAGSQEVTDAMEGIASVAEENSASIEEVSASAEEMSAQVEEVVASAEELSALAEELRAAAAQFRVEESSWVEQEQPKRKPQKAARVPASHSQQEVAPVTADQNDGYKESEALSPA